MKRILVIEDEPQTRENLVTILEMEGYQPLTASDGRAGLEMDGYAVLEALRAHPETISIPFIFLTAKGDLKDLRAGMNLGADDYLSKPVTTAELLDAIGTRLQRHRENTEAAQQKVEFKPNFDSTAPLEALGLTPREAEVLLWIAQGKSNGEIGVILGMSEKTVKIHVGHIFEKLGVDNRNAATVRAIEVLSAPSAKAKPPPR